MQNTKTNAGNLVWSCGPLNIVDIENSHFYYVLLSALYFHGMSHKCKSTMR